MMNPPFCIIPARIGSSRLPNKPLLPILGKTMIERVWQIALHGMGGKAAQEQVLVATDDASIAAHVKSFGGRSIMTSSQHRNGTERILEAAQKLDLADDQWIINLQGDAPLTPPWAITHLVEACQNDPNIEYASLFVKIPTQQEATFLAEKAKSPSSGTLVVCDKNSNALYFSKNVIPFRKKGTPHLPLKRHLGIYAYQRKGLERFCQLPFGSYEEVESLEQLRLLEHGYKIKMIELDPHGRTHASIDTPEDVAIVETIIQKEGELL